MLYTSYYTRALQLRFETTATHVNTHCPFSRAVAARHTTCTPRQCIQIPASQNASLDSDDEVENLVNQRLADTPCLTDDGSVVPPPPQLGNKTVRSSWNAVNVAFLGDAVFEMYVRRHYFFPPARSQLYADRVRKAVNAEAQDMLYQRLTNRSSSVLTDEEQAVLRWGRNRAAGSSAPKRFAGSSSPAYRNASALETLVGWLYLTDPSRLQCVMDVLGLGGAGRPPTPAMGKGGGIEDEG